jgi:hypothetical protein
VFAVSVAELGHECSATAATERCRLEARMNGMNAAVHQLLPMRGIIVGRKPVRLHGFFNPVLPFLTTLPLCANI